MFLFYFSSFEYFLFKADEQLRIERLTETRNLCVSLRKKLNEIRKRVVSETDEYKKNKSNIFNTIEKVCLHI
jgi:hypothetical protein